MSTTHAGLAQKLHIRSGGDKKIPWWEQLMIEKKARDKKEKENKKKR